MSTGPEATVVIPTHNRWRLLARTLESALGQNGVELEVIVVDDGSTDETPQQLGEVADERVRVIRHESSRGVAAARNAAIQQARGEWLAFLDDDDLWSPDKLRSQIGAARGADAAWAYSSAVIVDEHLAVRDLIQAPPAERMIERVLPYNPIPAGASNVVARREVVTGVGAYDEGFSQLADWDLWIRLAAAGPAASCPEPLIAYVQHSGAMLLADRRGVVTEFEQLAHKHRALVEAHGVSFDRAGLYGWIAWADSRAGRRMRAAAGYLRAAFVYARHRVGWATRANLGHAANALRGRVLTDTGRHAAGHEGRDELGWLAPYRVT
jgi:glycosyltransferase involved in cell wall biosynthesis